MGDYKCIYNIPDPSTLILGAGCGNTIIEKGEQCDCGFKENCKRYIPIIFLLIIICILESDHV